MIRMLVADDIAKFFLAVTLERGLAWQVRDRDHPAEPRSAMEEERNAAGFPRVQAKSFFSISAKEANGAPDAFWHIRQ
jgi:hypothetical protein